MLDLQRFALFAILPATIFPQALAQPGGTQVAIADVLLIVVLLAWLVSAAAGTAPQPWLRGNRLLVPVLVFVGMNIASLAWSDDQIATAKFAVQVTEIVVVFTIVFASLPTSLVTIRQGLLVYLAGTCLLAVYYLASGTQDIAGGLNKNVVGSYSAAGFVVAYTLFIGEARAVAGRVLLSGAVVLQGVTLVVAYSRGSIIGALIAILVVGLVLRRFRVATFGVVAVAAVFAAIYGFDSRTDLSQSGAYTSTSVRVSSFANAVEYIKARPFLGSGAGTYSDYIPTARASLPDPNNTFLLTWAEIGILGLVALLLLYARFTALLARAMRAGREAATLAAACGGVTISLLAHFQFDVTWTRGTSTTAFIMMGLMVAALRQGRRMQDPPPGSAADVGDATPVEPRRPVLVGA